MVIENRNIKKDFYEQIRKFEEMKREELVKPSPYVTHRDKIFAYYSTAIRIQNLILHLYNDSHYKLCDLSAFLRNADAKHFELVITILRRYHILGENDQDFMTCAREIIRSREGKTKKDED